VGERRGGRLRHVCREWDREAQPPDAHGEKSGAHGDVTADPQLVGEEVRRGGDREQQAAADVPIAYPSAEL